MSLTAAEIISKAIRGEDISDKEVLGIYADEKNWERDYNGPDGTCRYIWKGPVICAWEIASLALKEER